MAVSSATTVQGDDVLVNRTEPCESSVALPTHRSGCIFMSCILSPGHGNGTVKFLGLKNCGDSPLSRAGAGAAAGAGYPRGFTPPCLHILAAAFKELCSEPT